MYCNKKINQAISFGLILLSVLISVFLKSRAFTLGYIGGLAFMVYMLRRDYFLKHKYILLGGIFSLLPLFMFFVKTDSTLGRILIYKISLQILRQNFIYGVGWGKFPITYGHFQRHYFSGGDFSMKELLLADNTIYLFNDYLQFFIETGIIGLITMLTLLILFLLKVKMISKNKSVDLVQIMMYSQLISILIAAFFTHVFESAFVQIVVLTLLFIVIARNSLSAKIFHIALVYMVLCSMTVWLHFGFYIKNYKNYKSFEDGKDLFNAGYIHKALDTFKPLYPQMKNDVDYLNTFATILMTAGNYQEALKRNEELVKLNNGNLYLLNLATCYYRLGQYRNAETAYLNSINMVPNRFNTRYNLFNFYYETKQYSKAKKVGTIILQLPVKVPSVRISTIKNEVVHILKEL